MIVDWELARRIAHRVAERQSLPPNYDRAGMEEDFQRFTAQAEELVTAETGLVPASGPARGRVIERTDWVDSNIRSFQRMLKPLEAKLLADKSPDSDSSGGAWNRFTLSAGRRVAALEVGVLLGWMSARVLGQYDLLVVESENPEEQDLVYYVAPNIAALEWRHGFPPSEFRLWIALHEVTHRAQFTGIPWLRDHFLSLIDETMNNVSADPKRFMHAARQISEARKEGRNALADGGLAALVATPEQRVVLDQIGGMMSLLEGHGDITMDSAGESHLTEIPRFRRVISNRRAKMRGLTKLFSQLMGLEAKMNQYIAGEKFISEITSVGGPEALEQAWRGPECLPTMEEIREPELWVKRMEIVPA